MERKIREIERRQNNDNNKSEQSWNNNTCRIENEGMGDFPKVLFHTSLLEIIRFNQLILVNIKSNFARNHFIKCTTTTDVAAGEGSAVAIAATYC